MEVNSVSKYTTGEIAKICEVSVRTIQFYDTKEILKPSELTEGGRRLYSEDDLKKMRLICLLKSLGLSLDSIKGILSSETPNKILLVLLDEQSRRINTEIEQINKRKKLIDIVKEDIQNSNRISVNSITDIEHIMEGKKKLKKVYAILLTVGVMLDIIQLVTIILWIVKGMWLPFVIGMPIVLIISALLVAMYYRNTLYICPECNSIFKPTVKNFFFAKHTLKTRKLICTKCGYNGYCIETFSD